MLAVRSGWMPSSPTTRWLIAGRDHQADKRQRSKFSAAMFSAAAVSFRDKARKACSEARSPGAPADRLGWQGLVPANRCQCADRLAPPGGPAGWSERTSRFRAISRFRACWLPKAHRSRGQSRRPGKTDRHGDDWDPLGRWHRSLSRPARDHSLQWTVQG
jgi:hypothetical protein